MSATNNRFYRETPERAAEITRSSINRISQCDHCQRTIGWAMWLDCWLHLDSLRPECAFYASPRQCVCLCGRCGPTTDPKNPTAPPHDCGQPVCAYETDPQAIKEALAESPEFQAMKARFLADYRARLPVVESRIVGLENLS